MIIEDKKQILINSHDFEEADFGIDNEDIPFVMNILRNQIYSDKILAVVREYCTNAMDAHVDAGIPEEPIVITLPNNICNYFSVRDFGTGLTHDQIKDLYIKYCKSTKRQSNVFTGQLGIGCKSGFAYSDSFTIVSYINGHKNIYNACINEKNQGKVLLMSSVPNDERNGIEIIIPVLDKDKDDFVNRVERISPFFSVKPVIKGIGNIDFLDSIKDSISISGSCWKILDAYILEEKYHDIFYCFKGSGIAIMGNIPYEIDDEIIRKYAEKEKIKIFSNNYNGILLLNFDIGDLSISSSRESLEYTDLTIKNVVKKLELVNEENMQSMIDKINACESRNEVIDVYDTLHSSFDHNDIKIALSKSRFFDKPESYFNKTVYPNGGKSAKALIFLYSRNSNNKFDENLTVYSNEIYSFFYSSYRSQIQRQVSYVYINDGNIVVFEDENIPLKHIYQKILKIFFENKNIKNVFLVKIKTKCPKRSYSNFKKKVCFDDCKDSLFLNLSEIEMYPVTSSPVTRRKSISRSHCKMFKLADTPSNTYNKNWVDVKEEDYPEGGVYVPMKRFNIEWSSYNFKSIGYELISLKNVLSKLNIDFHFFGVRDSDSKNLDKNKWKSIFDWCLVDLLKLIEDHDIFNVLKMSLYADKIANSSFDNLDAFYNRFDSISENKSNPICKLSAEIKEIHNSIKNSVFSLNDCIFISKFRDIIISCFSPQKNIKKTKKHILDKSDCPFLFDRYINQIKDRYPLIKLHKYGVNDEDFVNYINMVDILNPII